MILESERDTLWGETIENIIGERDSVYVRYVQNIRFSSHKPGANGCYYYVDASYQTRNSNLAVS